MQSLTLALFFLGLKAFGQFVEASYNSTGNSTTSSTQYCLTSYGYSSVTSISSSTHTDTIPITVTTTLQQTPTTVTITPAPSTFTSISTVFSTITSTESTATDTFTSTSISTETDTITTTILSSAVVTDTVTTTVQSTATVAASAGFTALGSVYSGASSKRRRSYSADSESDYEYECDGEPPSETTPPLQLSCDGEGKPSWNHQLYPTAVACEKTIEIITTSTITIPANSTQTQTALASSVFVTQTSVSTVTLSVAPPDASTTITVSSTQTTTATVTETSTSTSTLTTTSTSVQPTATSYGACQANNIVAYISGSPIVEVDLTNGVLASDTATSASACCIQCATAAACGGFAYVSGSCFLLNDAGSCNGAVTSWGFAISSSGSPITVGNGNCGQGVLGG